MERMQAYEELKVRLTNKSLIKHSLAVEAIMRSLAEYLKDDIEKWGLAGLLHDIDYDKTAEDPSKHSLLGATILENLGIDDSIVYAVKAHNVYHGVKRKRKMDKALYVANPVSVLITNSALIIPSNKLEDVTADFVLNKFNDKSFEHSADREQILTCSELGISLEQFIEISLSAMKAISKELEL